MTAGADDVVRLESAQRAIRDHFLGWQCRLRQHAVRHREGRPSPGMCPDILLADKAVAFAQVVVLLLPVEPSLVTAEWRHMVRRTKDPKKEKRKQHTKRPRE